MTTLAHALQYLLENVEPPPERNCRCHIAPPCNDCIDHAALRDAIETAEQALKDHADRPTYAQLVDSVRLANRMYDVALPKFNWGASALDAEAIALINTAGLALEQATRALEGYE